MRVNVFWVIASLATGAIGMLGALFSYYPQRSLIWRQTASCGGVTHVGVLLETVFVALLAVTVCVLAGYVYSDAAATVLDGGPRSIVFGILITICFVAVVILHFTVLPCQWCDEYEKRFPRQTAELKESNQWDLHCAAVRSIYTRLYWMNGAANFCLLVSLLTIVTLGVRDDFAAISLSGDKLDTAAMAIDLRGLPEGELDRCHIAVAASMVYQEDLLCMTGRALVAAAMFSFVLLWFVATRFQDILGPTAINWGRVATCLVIFIGVPALLLFGWYRVAESGRVIDERVVALMRNARDTGEAAGVAELSELSQYVDKRCSVGGFVVRILSSWGGILFLLQFILSRIQKKLFHGSIYRNAMPSWGVFKWMAKRLQVMLGGPDGGG